jgi:hypothetical protein
MLLEPEFQARLSLDGTRLEEMLNQHKERKVNRGFMLWKLLQLALCKRRTTTRCKKDDWCTSQ